MKGNLSDYERYLKPIHLKGEARTFTIVKFTEEETHPQRGKVDTSLVVWFREVPFGLILSPTNRQLLWDTCDSLAGWIGKPITVKAVSVGKVGNTPRTPIRVVNTRPVAPSLNTTTGEVVPPAVSGIVPAADSKTDAQPSAASAETAGPPPNGGHGQAATPVTATEEPVKRVEISGRSELDEYFGSPKVTAQTTYETTPDKAGGAIWPTTETEYTAWLKQNGWNGKETRDALGTDAKSWLKQQAGRTWTDVAKQVHATLKGL